MKSGYEPWGIKIDDFNKCVSEEERIKFLLNFAVLAPSSHNSQPWAFSSGKDFIKVYGEPSRRLPIGDADDRQLSISLGCAIENIIVAASYYGYNTAIKYNDRGEEFATISFNKSGKNFTNDKNHLIFSIPRRMVNRSKYLNKKLGGNLLQKILSLSTTDLRVDIVDDRDRKIKLADLALDATLESMSDKAFREELSHYVISNTSNSKLGMPGFGIGFPTLISYIAPKMLKAFNMSKMSNKQDESLLKEHTPYMVVISTKSDDRAGWIDTGRTYIRIALTLAKEGVSTAVWAAPIQIGEYYKDFGRIVGTPFRPQMFFRVGYAIKDMGGHSPRLGVREVVKR